MMVWRHYVLLALLSWSATVAVQAKLLSKMLAEPVEYDEAQHYNHDGGRQLRHQRRRPRRQLMEQAVAQHHVAPVYDSDAAVFLGACGPDEPFSFPVSGHTHGLGAVGVQTNESDPTDVTLHLYLATGDGAIALTGDTQAHFFAGLDENDDDSSGMSAHRFEFDVDSANGVAVVECDDLCNLIVAYKDQSDVGTVQMQEQPDDRRRKLLSEGDRHGPKNHQQLRLQHQSAAVPLSAQINPRNKKSNSANVTTTTMNTPYVTHASPDSITIDSDEDGDVALIQVELNSRANGTVYRTVVVETGPSASSDIDVAPFFLGSTSVNDNGDLAIQFDGLPEGVPLLLQCRVAVIPTHFIDNITNVDAGDVDLRAIVDDGQLVLHGGWIRHRVGELGLSLQPDAFVIAIVEGLAQDPDQEYRIVGVLQDDDVDNPSSSNNNTTMSMLLRTNAGRSGAPRAFRDSSGTLSAAPSADETGISDDMIMGRRPPSLERRRLQSPGNGKLILVHGYCSSSNPWPSNQFSNAVQFLDRQQSRSNYQFATRIASFAANYDACSIVAHSQGGQAALTMQAYMWSCLDNTSSGGRPIQTVGTPYLGTPLAGQLAALAQLFGAGCGTTRDLTTNGAASWLATIPNWARKSVTYYTTSFTDRWWSYDYCHIATDVFLPDPDDGVMSKSKGQLAFGNNGGHKSGWCHISGMAYGPHCTDSTRNAAMNQLAAR